MFLNQAKKIAFFPEAAYGPALNSIGIAQAVQKLGHHAIFLSDPGFVSLYKEYGFEAYPVNLSAPMPPDEMTKFWEDFVNQHIPNFNKSPYEQIETYVKDCWAAIIDSAKYAQADLPALLDQLRPDLICVDNVILFPAIKQYGVPWVRIISCSENEIEDAAIPPHLSGCASRDLAGHAHYRQRFNDVIAPLHRDFNRFLASQGVEAYPLGQFFEVSPYLNLLLYPQAVKFDRALPLLPPQFSYLEGCVREEKPYEIPEFKSCADAPLIYVSFGSLGAGDIALHKRLIEAFGNMPYRVLVNVGSYLDQYTGLPPNVIAASWFPQPSVIPQVDLVIHHGGNNSFTECLYFGKPAIIMPFVWDGHDNASRVEETGFGHKMHRNDWSEAELRAQIERCLSDADMQTRLQTNSRHMQNSDGPARAAALLDDLLQTRRRRYV
jgi:MGT family glycosyltransferase